MNKTSEELLVALEGSREPRNRYLAVKIDNMEDKVVFSQTYHINPCLETFELKSMNSQETLMQANVYDIIHERENGSVLTNCGYRNMTGYLQHMVQRTRSDIATSVCILVQHQSSKSNLYLP